MSEVFVVFIHCFYLLNFQVYAEDLKYLHVKQTYRANNNTHTNKNKRMFAVWSSWYIIRNISRMQKCYYWKKFIGDHIKTVDAYWWSTSYYPYFYSMFRLVESSQCPRLIRLKSNSSSRINKVNLLGSKYILILSYISILVNLSVEKTL